MSKPKFGLMAGVGPNLVETFTRIQSFGIPTCQLHCNTETVDELFHPVKVKAAVQQTRMEISAVTAGFQNQAYDNVNGPSTLGLVPLATREQRVALMKHFSNVVAEIGIRDIVCHIGFIPDDDTSALYKSFIEMMQHLCSHLHRNGQNALVETGCELPSTLRRAIRDVGAANLFINFDTANVILYGKANPIDCVEIFGEHILGCHMKDGIWPNRDEALGHETPLGEGQVNFPIVIRRMKEKGFKGPYTIEREVTGPEQAAGVRKAMALLDPLI